MTNSMSELAKLYEQINRERAQHGGVRTVLIEYDAANGFGTPVRGLGMCKFVMKSVEGDDFEAKPSADIAKSNVALAGVGVGPNREVNCCESSRTAALLDKYASKGQYISQQVID